jgi:HK97 family phage major capsid protein
MNIIELKQRRSAAVQEMKTIHETAERAGRAKNASERSRFDELVGIERNLRDQLQLEEGNRDLSGGNGGGLTRADLHGETRTAQGGEMRRQFAEELRTLLTTGYGAALAPPEYEPLVWDYLRPKSVLLAAGPRIVNTKSHSVNIPHRTAGHTTAWTAEGGTITPGDDTGASVAVTPTKLAVLQKVSKEVILDGDVDILAMVQDSMIADLATGIDVAGFYGTGASNQPTGLANTAGITSQSMGTNGAAPTNLDFIKTALGSLAAANADLSTAAIFMAPRTWQELSELKTTTNAYLLQPDSESIANGARYSIDGVPVYVTSNIPVNETQGTSAGVSSSVFVVDMNQVVVVKREAFRLESTNDFYFDSDSVGVKAVARVGIAVPNPTAVVRIVGVL